MITRTGPVAGAAAADGYRHAGVAGGVGGHVGHSPAGADARHAILVAGPGEQAAEAADGQQASVIKPFYMALRGTQRADGW